MLNLYCYNSAIDSSVGFQEAGWTVLDGNCSAMNPAYASKEVQQLLLSGGTEAICMDTGRNTRVFLARSITVRQGMQIGWRLNFAFETDMCDFTQWKAIVSAFLKDFNEFTKKFAALFSVNYDGGEHFDLDSEKLLTLIHDAADSAEILQKTEQTNQEVLQTVVQAVFRPLENTPMRLLFLVPTVTADYFMRCTTLKELPMPELCIRKETWDALLTHKELPKETTAPLEAKPCPAKKNVFPLQTVAIIAGGLTAVALSAYGFQRVRKKHQRKSKRR